MVNVNFRNGFYYESENFENLKGNQIIEEYNLCKLKPNFCDYLEIDRCNIIDNPKALPTHPNKIIIFEMKSKSPEIFDAGFKGFIHPDGTITGKFVYGKALKIEIESEKVNGYYVFDDNNNLYVHANYININTSDIDFFCVCILNS